MKGGGGSGDIWCRRACDIGMSIALGTRRNLFRRSEWKQKEDVTSGQLTSRNHRDEDSTLPSSVPMNQIPSPSPLSYLPSSKSRQKPCES
ncbi:hypothetical protein TNIN_140461 [Trichonephila inaurata madagascariensis]|uniref:Uncharacterized protein n=1 Tax=Trichonephila inaurata madagascariensis TaxID=2747483 RepID=A0A8X7CJ43_9ARAC|nr:hypothetical protein TNIN_140461 [Trichonephila inaurata madagascariensis]